MAIIDDLINVIKEDNPDIKHIQELITQLLNQTEGINAKDSFDNTALIWAAYYGRQDIVGLLLKQQGIDVNLTDSFDNTALHFAAWNGYSAVAKLLVEQQGIDVNVKNNDGHTALDLAQNQEIKDLLQNHTPANGEFKDLYLTYKHSDEYVLFKLQAIPSEKKEEFTAALVTSLDDDLFAIYRLYNIDFGRESGIQEWIQGALKAKYNELSSIARVFYSIWHFLEEYVIYPIWGDEEQIALVGEDGVRV